LSRGLHAKRAAAHIGAIEVELEDFLFSQMMLEPEGKPGFLDLTLD
jgi:hypothetical protein